jgi:hypothetical protein
VSLFRQASKWALRALLVWGAIEAGAWLYDTGADHAASLTRMAGHRAAMARLEEHARASETRADAAERSVAALSGDTWTLPLQSDETIARAAARRLREELLTLGAEAPVVDAEEPQHGAGRTRLTARWREAQGMSPQVLHALAQRFPELQVERLVLTRGDPVSAELVVTVSVRAAPQQEASR